MVLISSLENVTSEEIKNLQVKLENAEKELNSASEKVVEIVNQTGESLAKNTVLVRPASLKMSFCG